MLGKLVPLFLMGKTDDPHPGLGFTERQVGIVNGTFGVIGIVVGGLVGGLFISRIGLRKSFWYLAAAMNVPNALYILAAIYKFDVPVMSGVMFFDQFGYGFGFAGYMIALMTIAQRNPKYTTAHMAIGTGLGATFIMLSGILSANLLEIFDFTTVFTIILFFAIPCLLTIKLLPLDDSGGKGVDVGAVDVEG
jgi:PAT family beta-lactamase induction signal transducer AmpG